MSTVHFVAGMDISIRIASLQDLVKITVDLSTRKICKTLIPHVLISQRLHSYLVVIIQPTAGCCLVVLLQLRVAEIANTFISNMASHLASIRIAILGALPTFPETCLDQLSRFDGDSKYPPCCKWILERKIMPF